MLPTKGTETFERPCCFPWQSSETCGGTSADKLYLHELENAFMHQEARPQTSGLGATHVKPMVAFGKETDFFWPSLCRSWQHPALCVATFLTLNLSSSLPESSSSDAPNPRSGSGFLIRLFEPSLLLTFVLITLLLLPLAASAARRAAIFLLASGCELFYLKVE